MNIVYSWIGKLPKYIGDSIYQTRLFFDGPIYLITNDINTDFLNKYNIIIVNYNNVIDNDIILHENRFIVCNNLNERSKLFFRGIERFFILKNLIKNYNLSNILFLEVDNLIYDNPNNWLDKFINYNTTIMYSGKDHLCTGIFFTKNYYTIKEMTDKSLDFLNKNIKVNGCLSEMTILSKIYNDLDKIHFLPGLWEEDGINKKVFENYSIHNSIFDPGGIGIYLYGMDPIHTNNVIQTGLTMQRFFEDTTNYSNYKYIFLYDKKKRKIPYIINKKNEHIKINSLHIHSKDIQSALSLHP